METFTRLYTEGLPLILHIDMILLMFFSVFLGITIGALPGLTVTMGISILLPFTYKLSPVAGIIGLLGVYVGGNYGGSISACLINIPGTPSAIMTTLDGYPMAKKGFAGKAIFLATTSSFLGGIFSVIVLSLISPVIARIALSFTSVEYFLIGIFGLSTIAYIVEGSFSKGIISALLGLLIATIGSDPMVGYPRFTFNRAELFTGVEFITAMIGLFGVAEILLQLEKGEHLKKVKQHIKNIYSNFKELKNLVWVIIRSSVTGVIIGAIPGAGGTIASIVSYGQQKRFSRHPERLGKGDPEGIVAAESANNACTGGAMITMLSLGIPGDAVTAILIGAFMIHGLRPGPVLFKQNFELVSAIFIGMFISNIFMCFIGLVGAPLFARLISLSKKYLNPAILVFTIIGSYAIRNNFFDVGTMLVFAVIGYLMAKVKMPRTPLVLALILGPIIESNLRRGLILVDGDILLFLQRIITRPISAFIFFLTIFILFLPLLGKRFNRKA